MLFSHLIFAAGAVLTSVNHPSRPDPGDFAHLLRQGRLSLSLTRRALPSAGVARRGSTYLSVSPMADSKPRMRWGKRPAKVQRSTRSRPEDHLTSYANATLAGLAPIVERVVLTVKNYDGPKELGMYDDRRALAVYKPTPRDLAIYKPTPRDLAVYKPTPRDLAVYDRPRSVALYSGPIYHDWLRLDANLYHIVSKTCAPRLVSSVASSAYQQDALRYLIDRLSQVFVIGEMAYTIGQQAKTHGHVFVVAATLIGTVLTFMECISLLYTIEHSVYISPSDSGLLETVQDLDQLELFEEHDHWWTGAKTHTTRKDALTIVLPPITSDPLPISSQPQARATQSRATSVRVINRRRGFLRALHDAERSRAEYDLD